MSWSLSAARFCTGIGGSTIRPLPWCRTAPGQGTYGAAPNAGTEPGRAKRPGHPRSVCLSSVTRASSQPGSLSHRSTGGPSVSIRTATTALATLLATAVLAQQVSRAAAGVAADADTLPQHLTETGLYAPDHSDTVASSVRPFRPQYPLWSDGLTKRRWISLPPGS